MQSPNTPFKVHRSSGILQGLNILGVITWAENTQNFFGMIGAILGAFSAAMIIVINWDSFISKPVVQRFIEFIRLTRHE